MLEALLMYGQMYRHSARSKDRPAAPLRTSGYQRFITAERSDCQRERLFLAPHTRAAIANSTPAPAANAGLSWSGSRVGPVGPV